jgi:hypothetical protein
MKIISRTIRFGVFSALKIGNLCAVYFPKGRPVFGCCRPRAVDTKNGTYNLTVLNLGRLLLMYESAA